jgi:membrane protein YdbS with pleckstrin-like domain
MKCPECGADVAENVVICNSCGARVRPDEELESSAGQPGPDAGQAPGGPAATSQPAPEGQVAGAAATAAEPAGGDEHGPPWRYSLKDMRIVWMNMLLLTIAMGAVAAVVQFGGWRPDWLPRAVLWGVLLGIPAIFWIYQLCKAIYRTTIRYDLDGSRLVHKEGIFVSQTDVVELIRISDMSATQSLLEKFLCGGIGKVRVHSDDPSNPDLVLRGLENHESVFRQIDERRAEARRKKAFIQA